MVPGLTELLLAAQLSVGTPTPPAQPVVQLPSAQQQTLVPLAGPSVDCKYSDFCCKPADGCKCNGACH